MCKFDQNSSCKNGVGRCFEGKHTSYMQYTLIKRMYLFTYEWHEYHFTNNLAGNFTTRKENNICGSTCKNETTLCKADCDGYCDICAIPLKCKILWKMDAKGNGIGRCKNVISGMS